MATPAQTFFDVIKRLLLAQVHADEELPLDFAYLTRHRISKEESGGATRMQRGSAVALHAWWFVPLILFAAGGWLIRSDGLAGVLAINGEPMPPAFRYSAGAILILAGFVYFVAHASWGSFRRVTIDRAKRTIRIQEGPWRRVRVYRSPDDVELRIMDATREPDDSGQFRPAIVLPEVGRDRVIVATHRALRSGKGATAVGAHLLAQVRNLM